MSELHLAETHVREGERLVAKQRQTLDHLSTNGHPTELAADILLTMEGQLEMHREHLARLRGI